MKIRSTVLFMILALLMVACRQQEPTPTIAPTAETEAIAPTEEPPLTTDAPTEAAQGATVDAPAIQNIVWQWERRVAPTTGAEESISNPGNYTLLFRPNGTVEYRADCNVGIGTYTADAAGAIQIQGGAVTAAACPEGSRDQDMLAMMSAVQSYRLEENGNVLVMVTADNGPQDFYRNQVTAGPGIEGEGGEETTATIGLSPEQITLDTQGLPYPWQANVVTATPYDNSQAPGPMGLPEHIQINFGTTDPAARTPEDPVMYIIPVTAYQELWDAAGDPAVTETITAIYESAFGLRFPPPISDMPVLPFEAASAVNDLAVQVGQIASSDSSATKSGFRFVGRFEQSPNPVTNGGLQYIYQGFTNDGQYLVSFFYPPVQTAALPADASGVPQAEIDQVNSDPNGYMAAKATELNALTTADWQPDLLTLDALVASLVIEGMPSAGLTGQVWQLAARSDGITEETLENTENHAVTFLADGRVLVDADCNVALGTYDATGGMVGSLAVQLGPMTLAACPPESHADELLETLGTAQQFRIRPGGQILELVRPSTAEAIGGSLLFTRLGEADIPPDSGQPPVELPPPDTAQPYGRVLALDGVNLRSGPGTNFPIVGYAPFGTEGPIIGVSQDRQWWVADAPNMPGGVVWVAAAYVAAFNAENVPVIATPPLPTPTAPTPAPTPTPQVQINFTADSTTIEQGQCTTLRWSVENIQAVWVYPLGQSFQDFPVTGQGSREVCPTFTTTYEMRVLRQDGVIELRQLTIIVNAPVNPLANTSWVATSLHAQVPLPGENGPLTLTFDPSTASGNSGCNTFSGPYQLRDNSLTIGPLISTQIACADQAISDQEVSYQDALQQVIRYQIRGNELILYNAAGANLLHFVLIANTVN